MTNNFEPRILRKDEYSEEQENKRKYIRNYISPCFRWAFPEISYMQYIVSANNGYETEQIFIKFQSGKTRRVTITGDSYIMIMSDLLKHLMY